VARPKKIAGIPGAEERITTAFLQMLEESGYSSITIGGLAERAQVNHNTIYYYYSNIDDLAESVLRKTMKPQMAIRLFTAGPEALMVIRAMLASSDIRRRLHIIQLYASAESSFLQSVLKRALHEEILKHASADDSSLSEAEKLTIEFLLSGFISLMGHPEARDNYAAIMEFQSTSFGAQCREAMRNVLKL
jgi:AcrR family transcriptional regulator